MAFKVVHLRQRIQTLNSEASIQDRCEQQHQIQISTRMFIVVHEFQNFPGFQESIPSLIFVEHAAY